MGGATTKRLRIGAVSLNQLDLARPPLFCEERLQRAVKAEQRVPTLGRIGLNPVALVHAGPPGRSKIDSGRAVGFGLRRRPWIALAADAWISLRGLQHGTGLVVVKGERPKFGGWNVRRERDLVGLGAVEILAPGIHECAEVS